MGYSFRFLPQQHHSFLFFCLAFIINFFRLVHLSIKIVILFDLELLNSSTIFELCTNLLPLSMNDAAALWHHHALKHTPNYRSAELLRSAFIHHTIQ